MVSLPQLEIPYAYAVVFGAVLLDVMALPWIAVPVLLIAGGLAATGKLSLGFIIGFATVAAAVGDTLWYLLGRYERSRFITLLDKIAGQKKRYLFRAIELFQRHGTGFLVVSKFVPVIACLACPAAGILNMSVARFLVVNALTRVLWAASVSWLGYWGIS
jgi:membrane protein DedA with SNARE-associated domain